MPVPYPSDAGKTTRLKFPRTIHMYMFGLIFIEDFPSRKNRIIYFTQVQDVFNVDEILNQILKTNAKMNSLIPRLD